MIPVIYIFRQKMIRVYTTCAMMDFCSCFWLIRLKMTGRDILEAVTAISHFRTLLEKPGQNHLRVGRFRFEALKMNQMDFGVIWCKRIKKMFGLVVKMDSVQIPCLIIILQPDWRLIKNEILVFKRPFKKFLCGITIKFNIRAREMGVQCIAMNNLNRRLLRSDDRHFQFSLFADVISGWNRPASDDCPRD